MDHEGAFEEMVGWSEIVLKLKIYALGAAAFIAAILMYRGMIRRDIIEKIDAQRDKAYRETRERMDEVNTSDDIGVLRDWLRERGDK